MRSIFVATSRTIRAAAFASGVATAALVTACAVHHTGAPPRFVDNDSLRLYVAHAERNWTAGSEQQAMTIDTLDRLADAIASLAVSKGAVSPTFTERLSELRSSTVAFASGKLGANEQAAALRETFGIAASMVRSLVNATSARDADDDLTALDRSAAAIDAARPLPLQADAIERFFQTAAATLERVDAMVR